jgi:hypothetical protein
MTGRRARARLCAMIQSLAVPALLSLQGAEGAEKPLRHLPMPPVAFGILALAAFIVLLGITYAFRSSGTKH